MERFSGLHWLRGYLEGCDGRRRGAAPMSLFQRRAYDAGLLAARMERDAARAAASRAKPLPYWAERNRAA
jgi:hypothetical protein